MHTLTSKLRQHMISQFDESYDRIKSLKNTLAGETIYILAPGPSLLKTDKEILKQRLSNKFVIALKQAYEYMPEYVDLQLLNFCNLDRYDYNDTCIVGWSIWDINQPNAIFQHNFRCDFILDTYKLGDGTAKLENTIAASSEFEKLSIDYSMSRPWGPGTMYEMAIPLAVYMGCSEIITIGWDLFNTKVSANLNDDISLQASNHYSYNNLTFTSTETRPSLKEARTVIKSTKTLNTWLHDNNVKLTIFDPYNDNPADSSINRIQSL